MVFSSHIFLFYFLPFAILMYYLGRGSLRLVILTLLSYVFYAWTNPWFVLLLIWSTIVDFCAGNLIDGHWQPLGWREDVSGHPAPAGFQRKLFLGLSLCNSIGMLFAFKYFAFAEQNLNALRQAVGLEPYRVLAVLLPAGISFYTFESISYVLDIYRGKARSASATAKALAIARGQTFKPGETSLDIEFRGFLNFACYIAQFPHLVAGPIIRFQDLEPQMYDRPHTIEKFSRGIFFICLGLAKKTLIADTLGEVADFAFTGRSLYWADAWFGVFGYAFQIYFDFSGYSDMAIGLGLLFGFEFPKNFDSPYKSQSITEFWRRWHITLSMWLRDYLYFGLGGNRKGALRTYLNLMIVMLLGGLWHGAAWTFMIWGGIHGGWLALERMLGRRSFYASLPGALRVAMTFFIVCIAWVFFRSKDLPAGIRYVGDLFSFARPLTRASMILRAHLWTPAHLLVMAAAALLAFFGTQTWDLSRRISPARSILAFALLGASIVSMSVRSYSPFLYFRF